MKRLCSYCGSNMGEKCARCASEFVVNLGRPRNFDPAMPDLYECLSCHKTYVGGKAGETHGVCPTCRAGQVSSARYNIGVIGP